MYRSVQPQLGLNDVSAVLSLDVGKSSRKEIQGTSRHP